MRPLLRPVDRPVHQPRPLEATTGPLYAHADDDPANLSDPSGLFGLSDISDFAAGFGDAVTSPLGSSGLDT
jgi:hypothetical protein